MTITGKILTYVGAGILVILAAAGIWHLTFPKSGGLFSAISLSREQVKVSANPAVTESEEPFTISWSHEKKSADGAYELIYNCTPDIAFTLQGNSSLECNSAFPLSTSSSSLVLVPHLNDPRTPRDVTFSVRFTPDGALQASFSGSIVVTITPKQTSTTPSNSQNTTSTTNAQIPQQTKTATPQPGLETTKVIPITGGGERTVPGGKPDLAVQIVDIGILATTSTSSEPSVFQHATSTRPDQRAAVIFDVVNLGTNNSGQWRFTATLPVAGGNYTSDLQASLAPGEKIRFTMGFDNVQNAGNHQATFIVDPDNQTQDSNRANNTANVIIVRNP